MSDKHPLVEPTNREVTDYEVIDHIHTLHRATLQCQLEGFKLVLNRLHAIERRLERIESYVVNSSRASNL